MKLTGEERIIVRGEILASESLVGKQIGIVVLGRLFAKHLLPFLAAVQKPLFAHCSCGGTVGKKREERLVVIIVIIVVIVVTKKFIVPYAIVIVIIIIFNAVIVVCLNMLFLLFLFFLILNRFFQFRIQLFYGH